MREPLGEFLRNLHAWIKGTQAAPKLPVTEPRITLH